MDKMVKVNFRDIETKNFPVGTSLLEVSHSFGHYYNYPILVAKKDNEICDLRQTIDKKCYVDFYDRSSVAGNDVYSCSVQLLMIVALKKVLGEDVDVKIQNSIDRGVYCQIINSEVDKQLLKKIEDKMIK